MRQSVDSIIEKKRAGEKITVLTAYDFTFAPIVDAAGIDIILVGDSLANVILGMESTTQVSLDEMIQHSIAVVKGSERAMVVGDMPYCAYQENPAVALPSARRFTEEAGCGAVKLEWCPHALEVTARIVEQSIPVMGHIGFTPQTADKLGGSIVQGKDFETARRLVDQARAFQEAGCFSIVLECVPWQIARVITETLTIPTIGIGAGPHCDGQVLVLNDMLGLFKRFRPKFVRVFADLYDVALAGIEAYAGEVRAGTFPSEKESFSMKEEEFLKFKESLHGKGN